MEKKKRNRRGIWLSCCTLAVCLAGLTACRTSRSAAPEPDSLPPGAHSASSLRPKSGAARPAGVSSPVVYIYKTKQDYSRLVPVLMDETRTRIVSYPAPTDLKTNGRLAYPTPLEGGYWLDNRGISPRAAFLSYTYEEYSQLKEPPAMEEMMERIVDKDPFTFIRASGRRADYKDIVGELNEYIRKNLLK